MSDKIAPVGHKTRLFIVGPGPEEFVTFLEYRDSKAKQHKLDPSDISKIAACAKAGVEFDTSDIEDKTQKRRMDAYKIEAEADMAAHEKNRAIYDKNTAAAIAKKKEEKEAAEKAKEEDKKESLSLMTRAEGGKVLVTLQNSLTAGADKGIGQVLGKAFKLTEEGLLEISGDPKKSDFANAFAGINGLHKTSDIIKDRSAKTEAQLAFSAKEVMGDNWVNLFSHVPKDLARVNSALKIFSVCNRTKSGLLCFTKLPISTTKALTEMKVTTKEEEGSAEKAIAKNLEAKLAVLKTAAALLKERLAAGGSLTQTEAKNLVTDYKKEQGIDAKTRYKYCYGHVIDGKMIFSGSEKVSDGLLGTCAFCFDYNLNQLVYKGAGKADSQPITGPGKAVAALAADFEEDLKAQAEKAEKDKEAGKKAPKKAASKAPTAAELDDDDELPTPVGKKAVKVEFSEEEEENAPEEGADPEEELQEEEAPAPTKKTAKVELEEEDDDEPVRPAKKTVALIDLDDE